MIILSNTLKRHPK